MKNYYITFTKNQSHDINGQKFDKDSICLISAISHTQARKKAESLFGDEYSTVFKHINPQQLDLYPRGILILK